MAFAVSPLVTACSHMRLLSLRSSQRDAGQTLRRQVPVLPVPAPPRKPTPLPAFCVINHLQTLMLLPGGLDDGWQ